MLNPQPVSGSIRRGHLYPRLAQAARLFRRKRSGPAGSLIGKAVFAQIEFATDSPLEGWRGP